MLHRHPVKDETFLVIAGELAVQTSRRIGPVRKQFAAAPGERVHVPPGTWHRFANRGTGVVEFVEASTRDDPDDTQRAEPSGPYREEDWT